MGAGHWRPVAQISEIYDFLSRFQPDFYRDAKVYFISPGVHFAAERQRLPNSFGSLCVVKLCYYYHRTGFDSNLPLHLMAPCENIPRFLIILVYDRPHYTTTVQMLKHNTTVIAVRAYVIHPQEVHLLFFLPIDDATGPDAAHSCFQHSLASRWHIE